MTTKHDTTDDDWHQLLDRLCLENGHLDNMALAEQFCAEQGNQSLAAFDTAVKNLRNWRQGFHIPQRKNLILLGKVLEIDKNPELQAEWNRRYAATRGKAARNSESDPQVEPPIGATSRHVRLRGSRSPTLLLATVLGTAVIGLALWLVFTNRQGTDLHPVAHFETTNADYTRNISVRVGDAIIVHGARGNDCGPAPAWEETQPLLPALVTGILSDGGLGTRYSRACGGRIPARAILFTATSPGIEQTAIYGDEIHIAVTP